MNGVELAVFIICAVLFILSCVLEKYFRRLIKNYCRDGEEDAKEPAKEPEAVKRKRTARIVASAASALSAAGIFTILLVTGTGHAVQLGAVLVMLFLVLV